MTGAERARRHRARKKMVQAPPAPPYPENEVEALISWARSTLKVPAGHPLAGQPMPIPPFVESWLRDTWGSPEALLSISRKSGKTSAIAAVILCFLCGPLMSKGWAGAVASLNVEKAGKLRADVIAIAEASGLRDKLGVRRSPYPGRLYGKSMEGVWHDSELPYFLVLSSDKAAGDSLDLNIVITDELGLTEERDRQWFNSLRESLSAREGNALHISIRGDSPLLQELIDNPQVPSVVYSPDDPACPIDCRESWYQANPAFECGIKSLKRFEEEVERIRHTPADEPTWRAKQMNIKMAPAKEMIVTPDDLRGCFGNPKFEGPCVLAHDFGGALSGTASCAIWIETGAVRTWFAFGSVPALKHRARRDNAPYEEMLARGELKLYPGRVTDIAAFLEDVAADLAGFKVLAIGQDNWKKADGLDYIERAGIRWPIALPRTGTGEQGSFACRAFQNLIQGKRLVMAENLSLSDAILKSTVRYDGNGNVALDKSSGNNRIDTLSAAVIAAGLAWSRMDKKKPSGPGFNVYP